MIMVSWLLKGTHFDNILGGNMEYRKKCNVCGKIWCYTDEDIKQNTKNAGLAALSSIGAVANVFVGTRYDAYEQTKMSDRAISKIRDFSKCPDCGSTEIRDISVEEFGKMQKSIGLTKTISINSNASVDSIIKRIELFMEDGAWEDAAVYCEHALDIDADNGYLWLLKLLISCKWKIVDGKLVLNESYPYPMLKMEGNEHYERVRKFAEKDADLKKKVDRIKNEINEDWYSDAVEEYNLADSDPDMHFYETYEDVEKKLFYIKDYKDSARYIKLCRDKKNEIKEHDIYLGALQKLGSDSIDDIKEAKEIFQKNSQWNDAGSKINECNEKLKILDLEGKRKNAQKKIIIVSFVILIVVVSAIWMINQIQKKIKVEKTYEQLIGEVFCGTYERMKSYEVTGDWREEKTIEIEFVGEDEYNLLYRRRTFNDGEESSNEESFTVNRKYQLKTINDKVYIEFDCSRDSYLASTQPFIIYFDKNNEITEISTSDFSQGIGMKIVISDKDGIEIPSSQGTTADN